MYKDVIHIGYTDLPSRLPTQASTLYANNISKLLLSMGEKDHFNIDLTDEVVRGSIILNKGELMWPAPVVQVAAPVATTKTKTVKQLEAEKLLKSRNYFAEYMKDSAKYTMGISGLIGLSMVSPSAAFANMITTFSLSGIVGYHTVWNVSPALHSPLMSVTNAISGITAVGGLLLMGGGMLPGNTAQWLAATAAFISAINISGGFIITQRMLDMFKRPTDPPEYNYLYGSN